MLRRSPLAPPVIAEHPRSLAEWEGRCAEASLPYCLIDSSVAATLRLRAGNHNPPLTTIPVLFESARLSHHFPLSTPQALVPAFCGLPVRATVPTAAANRK
jgi:hypothetical protein